MTTLNRHIDSFHADACTALARAVGALGGCPPDPACCERALRAYFGHRWPGSSDRLTAVEVVEGSNFLHRLCNEIVTATAHRGETPGETAAGEAARSTPSARGEALPHHGDDVQWWDYARALHGEDARAPHRRTDSAPSDVESQNHPGGSGDAGE